MIHMQTIQDNDRKFPDQLECYTNNEISIFITPSLFFGVFQMGLKSPKTQGRVVFGNAV